ncbi:TPA: mechanosensitive ion channel family protein [Candidatus Poribacteria bacterium]|nr:mechanosensitive ion channel family protein [Candidatus Poribacteria bacterium]HIO81105.1 mechanosensitive ion channel family protein [Candidatus Poribacteria bacterium]
MDKLIEHWSQLVLGVGAQFELAGRIVGIILLIILYPILYSVSRRLIYATFDRLLAWIIKENLDLNEHRLAKRLTLFFFACISYAALPFILIGYNTVIQLARNINMVCLILVGTLVISSFLDLFLTIYGSSKTSHDIPLKATVQVIKIVVYFVCGIFIVSLILNKTPLYLLSGLSALGAVLLLVFRDSILGFVAGIQLIANRMVAKGDWIEMPKYDADGDVIEIALTTVKVQNWDKTIATIPTYALIGESFKNWRGMKESGGRRIKRTINIDVSTIKFCNEEMLKRFSEIQYIANYIQIKKEELSTYNDENEVDNTSLANGRRLTNVGTFRAYTVAYLRNHPMISQEMTFLVRHLAPAGYGLPIEIYVFSKDTIWANYEGIQADIFDHLLAVVPEFDLKVFQNPSGSDFHRLVS